MMYYLIDHESKLYGLFQMIIIVCCTYTSFLYANILAHKQHYADKGLPIEIHVFELIFLLDFLLKFVTSYNDVDKANNWCKIFDMQQIAVNYYESTFWQELIPLIPLQLLSPYN